MIVLQWGAPRVQWPVGALPRTQPATRHPISCKDASVSVEYGQPRDRLRWCLPTTQI